MENRDPNLNNAGAGSATTRRMLGAIAVCAFFVILFAVVNDSASGFDDPVRFFFYGLQSDVLTGVAMVITTMSNAWFMIGFCILLLLIPRTRLRFGVPLSAGALLTVGLNQLIKNLVDRPRPEVTQLMNETGFSFPSGHSINSMFFYGMAIWLVWHYLPSSGLRTALMIVLAIPMVFVGPTRIYLGVHYPTDVLAGWCLGIIAIVVMIEIILWWERRKATQGQAADQAEDE